jgi:hypothetical protein
MTERFVSLLGSTSAIREERGTLIVPVIAFVGDSVIHAVNAEHPEFVPIETISQDPSRWNSKPVMWNHPRSADGKTMSASHHTLSESNLGFIGNTCVDRGRLCCDAIIDVARATRLGASKLLQRLRNNEIVSVSIGAHVQTTPAPPGSSHNGRRYDAIWSVLTPDHLAILPDSEGACSIADGCGTHRRAAEVTPPVAPVAPIHLVAPRESIVPDAYSSHLPRPTCPCDDKNYQPFGEPNDPYAEGLTKLQKRK